MQGKKCNQLYWNIGVEAIILLNFSYHIGGVAVAVAVVETSVLLKAVGESLRGTQ